MTDEQPAAFDWVRHRALCNVREMFFKLAEVVKGDVEAANATVAGGGFVFEEHAIDQFRATHVTRSVDLVIDSRGFRIKDSRIVVRDGSGRDILSSRVALLPGDCLLQVDDQPHPLRLWEFSRLALEPLFFNGQ